MVTHDTFHTWLLFYVSFVLSNLRTTTKSQRKYSMLKNEKDHIPHMFKDGNKRQIKHQMRARKALPVLIKRAETPKPISFKKLAIAIDLGANYARPMKFVCQCIRTTLYELESSGDWKHEEIPHITSIVTYEGGAPAGFISEELEKILGNEPTEDDYQKEYNATYKYEKWNAVLEALGLPEV